MVSRLRRARGKRGFTLLELIVTMAVTVIIAIVITVISISSTNIFHDQNVIIKANDVKDTVVLTFMDRVKAARTAFLAPDAVNAAIDSPVSPTYIQDFSALYVKDGRLYIAMQDTSGSVTSDVQELLPKNNNYDPYCGYGVRLYFKPIRSQFSTGNRIVSVRMTIEVYDRKNGNIISKGDEVVKLMELDRVKNSVGLSGSDTDTYTVFYFD